MSNNKKEAYPSDYLEEHRLKSIQEQRVSQMKNLGFYVIDENGDLTPEGKIHQLKTNLYNLTIDTFLSRLVDSFILSALLTFIFSLISSSFNFSFVFPFFYAVISSFVITSIKYFEGKRAIESEEVISILH